MTLANPLGLLAALLAVPLAVWYLLRSRRPPVTVSSTFLWRRSDESITAALPWQRFTPDLTFWLVLLAILAGAVALARPAFPVAARLGDHTILVMDVSASMLADEGGPSRLELARREAEKLVARMGPGQTVSVVEAADRARVLLSASGEAGTVRRALRSAGPSEGAADLRDAFTLAAALQQPGGSNAIILLTDGEVPDAIAAAAPPGLRVIAVGRPRPNLAVTRVQAVPLGGGTAQVFAQVRNYGTVAATGRLRLVAEGAELVVRDLALLPRGSADVVTEVPVPAGIEGAPVLLRATVEPVDGGDALAVDDTAVAVVRGERQLVALVAGPGNVFLETALAALGADVRPADRVPADLSGVDLLVVDRVPVPAEPPIPTFAVAPASPPDGVVLGEPVNAPALTFADPASELLRDVDLSGVAIAEARAVGAPVLATVAGGPDGSLIAAGRLAGQPYVHLGFDLLASNLPLEVAWPVLVGNVVTWLTSPPAAVPVTVGSEVELAVPEGVAGVEVVPPSGRARGLSLIDPRFRADQVGVYETRWLGPDDVLANLPPPSPIAVNPVAEEGDLARDAPVDVPPAGGTAGGPAPVPAEGRRVIGPGILVAVLVLLLAEWAHAHGVRPLAALRRRRAQRIARAGGTA